MKLILSFKIGEYSVNYDSKKKLIVVIGGAGFCGRSMVKVLSQEGVRILNLDLNAPKELFDGEEYQKVDIVTENHLEELFKGADSVINLAGRQFATPPKPPKIKTFEFFKIVQVTGCTRVRNAALKAGVKSLVYVSTDMVYGLPKYLPLDENHPTNPLGPYGRSKILAEQACLEADSDNLAVCIFRPRFIVGQGRFGVLAVLFSWIKNNRPIIILGNGKNSYMMVGVDDLSRACLMAVEKRARGIFNIGTEPTPTMGEIIQTVIDHAGSRSRIIPVPTKILKFSFRFLNLLKLSPLWPEQYKIADLNIIHDLSKIKNELNWYPQTNVIDMNIQAYDAYVRAIENNEPI